MSDPTRCEVCDRLADRECDRCGTAVCVMHYDGELGFCGECATRRKADDRRGDTFHL